MAEAGGVGDCFDFDDLSVVDGETRDHEESPAWRYDDSDLTVDENRPRCTGSGPCFAMGYCGCATIKVGSP